MKNSKNKKNSKKKKEENSRKYWEKRNKQKLSAIEAISDKNIKRIDKAVDTAIANIDYQIQDLYISYGEKNNLSYAETLKYLNNNERKEFQMNLKEYTEKAKDTANHSKYYKDLLSVSTRVRVSRLEALKANIRKEIAIVEQEMLSQNMFQNIFNESNNFEQYSIEQFTGVKLTFDKPSKDLLKELIINPWSGKDYSSKVWGVTDKLVGIMEETLTKGLIQGKSSGNISQELHHKLYGNKGTKKTKYEVARLIRTESAYVKEQATANMYERLGVEEYEISATLDFKTSEKCQALDQKKFKFKDKVIGINYPPFHPFCRTTTIPVSEFDDIPAQRIAKDKDGKIIYVNKMNYSEWKDKYINIDNNLFTNNGDNDILSNNKWLNSNFANEKKYTKHIKKHLHEYPGFKAEDYLNEARNLLASKLSEDIEGFSTDAGFILKYRKSTNDFAAGTPDGKISTLFKPDAKYQYWLDEKQRY